MKIAFDIKFSSQIWKHKKVNRLWDAETFIIQITLRITIYEASDAEHPKYDQQNAEYCIGHLILPFKKSHSRMRVTLIFYLFFLASISARASLRERLILPIRSISVTLTIISSPTETISSTFSTLCLSSLEM